jgi:transcriptional regulator with XRE-family HTH domain
MLGWSQGKLAEKTFQQVQKYESGKNRGNRSSASAFEG